MIYWCKWKWWSDMQRQGHGGLHGCDSAELKSTPPCVPKGGPICYVSSQEPAGRAAYYLTRSGLLKDPSSLDSSPDIIGNRDLTCNPPHRRFHSPTCIFSGMFSHLGLSIETLTAESLHGRGTNSKVSVHAVLLLSTPGAAC